MSGISDFRGACQRLDGGRDQNLTSYFEITEALNELARFDTPQTLAVGMKGVGKSAAFRYLTELDQGADVVVGLTPENYTLHLPNKDLHYSTSMKQFEYDLVIEALRAIDGRRAEISKKIPAEKLKRAKSQVTSHLKLLKEVAGRVGGISVLGSGFTLNNPRSSVLVGLEGDTRLSTAREVLEDICSYGIKVRIVVDDPEQVFSASRELDAHLVGGFCLAAMRLSSSIDNVKVVALLKSHIYYPLLRQIDDLGKYPDHAGRLSWSQDKLIKVVDRRLSWAQVKWTDVFQGSEAQGRTLAMSMMNEIRNGPRDLLRWIYFALQNSQGAAIRESHIDGSRSRMAVDSLMELESSFASEYEGITSVLRIVFGADIRAEFSVRELRKHIADLQVTNTEMSSLMRLGWMQQETSQTLPRVFLRVGALTLELNHQRILPYQAGYDEEHLELADKVTLVPAIAVAIA